MPPSWGFTPLTARHANASTAPSREVAQPASPALEARMLADRARATSVAVVRPSTSERAFLSAEGRAFAQRRADASDDLSAACLRDRLGRLLHHALVDWPRSRASKSRWNGEGESETQMPQRWLKTHQQSTPAELHDLTVFGERPSGRPQRRTPEPRHRAASENSESREPDPDQRRQSEIHHRRRVSVRSGE